MSRATHRIVTPLILTALLLGLPLLGVILAGRPVSNYAVFPPLTEQAAHAPFSWIAFIGLALAIAAVCFPFEFRALRWRRSVDPGPGPVSRFPWWGWMAIGMGIGAWIVAWTRYPSFSSFQPFTFTPLWLCYIAIVNALTFRRTGHCMLRDRPAHLLTLFFASALFWWFFEYLNRFVENWYYIGIGALTRSQYVLFATLPFATVLPAVLGTYELLDTYPGIGAGLDHFIRVGIPKPKATALLTLLLFSLGLLGIGIFPDLLFPLLWVSPLFIICSIQAIQGQPTLFACVRTGNWRRVYLLAMSALICGCFWEMWNAGSMAKWIYTIPFVGRFKIFEMPILGFAGYLPFGLECAVISDMLTGQPDTQANGGPA